jgi:MFS family permease
MPSRPRLTWILSGLGLSLLLPLLGTIASKLYFPTLRLEHLPFHSMIETVGGLIAIAIAGILIAEHPSRHHSQHYIWMASALIGMGVLDLCHAAVLPGNHFVWIVLRVRVGARLVRSRTLCCALSLVGLCVGGAVRSGQLYDGTTPGDDG